MNLCLVDMLEGKKDHQYGLYKLNTHTFAHSPTHLESKIWSLQGDSRNGP